MILCKMSSKPTKSILKERPIDFEEEVETARRGTTRAELLFQQFVDKKQPKKCDTYSNRRKPLTTMISSSSANQKPIDSSVSDLESNDSKDGDFEPSAKTSRTRIKKTIDKRLNRVKFDNNCDKKMSKKIQNKKKCKAYPDCTKEGLLEAYEGAGLPDYEQIAKFPLHVTNVKDCVKAYPPTPSMDKIMAPFADLVVWSDADRNSDEPNIMSHSAKETTNSSDWETESTENTSDEQTVKSISNVKSSLKSGDENISKLEFRRESLNTAGVGAHRIASTPVQRTHNVTFQNVSPINSTNSPDVDISSSKAKVTKSDKTFVSPLPPRSKSRRVPKISAPKEVRPLDLDVIEPSISDLKKVTLPVNRSKQLLRSLIDAPKPSIVLDDWNVTIAEESNKKSGKSCRTLTFCNTKSLRNRTLQNTGVSELSSIFDPIIRSTPLVASKQKHSKTSKFELVIDRSHFDVSLSKMCRSDSTSAINDFSMKTTTIVPVLDSQHMSQTKKRTNRLSNAYHLYRRSIDSVHSLYNKSCKPFRTIIRHSDTDNTLMDDSNDQTIRRTLKNEKDLKRVFDKSLSASMFSSSKLVSNNGRQSVLTAKQKVLIYCEPNEVIDFKSAFDKTVLNKCRKIGEGSYGEVFSSKDSTGRDVVIKVIPLIQDENKTEEESFAQILPELVISLQFNRLKTGILSNRAPNYIDLIKATTASGLFPQKLIQEWDKYDEQRRSENEDPRIYTERQLYMVLYLANGGTDLENYKFKSAVESLSIFVQLAMALAAAEVVFEFEHRDLHWGNVLISTTTETRLDYCVDGNQYNVNPNGVFASIIDFSLSRMADNEFTIFDDLAKYSDLFEGDAAIDYQFEIYRLMKANNGNNWQKFVPKTNIFWLHYMSEKMINWKKYSSNRTKVHKNAFELIKNIYNNILDFDSATDLIKSKDFAQYLLHLN